MNQFTEFTLLTESQALEYLAYVRNRREIDLNDLCQLITSTGGSIDVFDGSLASLDVLWAWGVAFGDSEFLTVPDGIPLGGWPGLVTGQSGKAVNASFVRQRYVAQLLEAYVEAVCRTYDPTCDLATYNETRGKRVRDVRLGSTGVVLSTGQWVDLDVFVPIGYHKAVEGLNPVDRDSSGLSKQLTKRSPEVFARPTPPDLQPVLAPFVGTDWVDFADPRRLSPSFEYEGVEFPKDHRLTHPALGEKELYFAAGPVEGFERLNFLNDLNDFVVAALLRENGFTPVTPEALCSSQQEIWMDDLVVANSFPLASKLKFVVFTRINADDTQWVELAIRIERYAAVSGTRLGAIGAWPQLHDGPS